MIRTIIGDPHIKPSNVLTVDELFQLVEEIGRDAVWLGDFLDTKELMRGKCFNALFAYLKRSKLHHTILIGNHDYFNLDCLAHSLEALKVLPNVTIVDAPMEDENCVYFPYIHDRDALLAAIDRFKNSNKTLFGHLEVRDFDYGNGHLCTTGIELSALKVFKRVISGHFHKFQQSGNVTFLGTPISHSFGESNQVKYLGMYDDVAGDLQLAESPFPRHLTVEFDCDSLDGMRERTLVNLADPNYKKHFYRIILTGKQENIDRFPRSLYEEDKLQVKWLARPSDHAENNVAIDENLSNEAQFVKWATSVRKMDETTLNLGMSILEACK